jgi:hypothetical protein
MLVVAVDSIMAVVLTLPAALLWKMWDEMWS